MKQAISIAIVLLGFTSGAWAEPVDIRGEDSFILKGDYHAGTADGAGVLMLHQCNRDRQMYAPIAEKLKMMGIHTLAIDFRAFGESQAGDYTAAKIEAIKSEDERRSFFRTMVRDIWRGDVTAAYDYLRAKVKDGKPIGVIGASCGGAQAVRLASERDVKTLSLFSSATSPRTMEVYQALPATPTLFITSEEELPGIQPYFDLASHPSNRLIEYKGEGHGEPLMVRDPSLAGAIANWFEAQLRE